MLCKVFFFTFATRKLIYNAKVQKIIDMYNTNKEKILKKIAPGRERYSFAKGWFQALTMLTIPQALQLEADILRTLRIKRPSCYRRLIAETMPSAQEYLDVQDVFAKYGVTDVYYKNREDYEADLEKIFI